jgi:PPK2 family polyphosphate:nucleotide phosphotransferase
MKQEHRFDHKAFLVPPGKKIRLEDYDPRYTADLDGKKEGRAALVEDVSALAKAQEVLWASAQYSVLVVFQALDAAGKDGTIKHVMSGVNPQGVDVHGFKAPNEEERQHHFLWRPTRFLPRRGRIAIFNRSYYEEVLVVRVHPEFLDSQWVSEERRKAGVDKLWDARYDDINRYERALTCNGTCIVKFFLNVSKEEQKERFLERLTTPEKQWKFSAADFEERGYWDRYQEAYEDMLNATSTEWAPWYVIPADRKWFLRAAVADIIAARIWALDLEFPKVSKKQRKALEEIREKLESEKSP